MTMSRLRDLVNGFAFDFLKVICSKNSKGNVFYSPFNLVVLLTSVAVAENSSNRSKIFTALKGNEYFKDIAEMEKEAIKMYRIIMSGSHSNELYFANKVLLNTNEINNGTPKTQKSSTSTSTINSSKFTHSSIATVEEVNFDENNSTIVFETNDWVNQMTFGNIRSLTRTTDSTCSSVLINVGYFHGVWRSRFDVEQTEVQPFYNHFGQDDMHMMFAADIRCKAYKILFPDQELDVVELPFVGPTTMTIILPQTVNGLDTIFESLDSSAMEYKEEETKSATVFLPRFKLDAEYKLNSALNDIGIDQEGNEKTDVFHKCVIDVNEDGKEEGQKCNFYNFSIFVCSPGHSRTVRVDHPFVFFIKDTLTGIILFIGRINQLKQ